MLQKSTLSTNPFLSSSLPRKPFKVSKVASTDSVELRASLEGSLEDAESGWVIAELTLFDAECLFFSVGAVLAAEGGLLWNVSPAEAVGPLKQIEEMLDC